MLSCSIYGCTNNTATNADSTVQYYYFPKHSVIAQQWITACWRADPIDINTARICSIHFDNNSYSSEYKMLDYMGGYTRMLKYEAIPTLYLPNPQTPVIMKTAIEQTVGLNMDTIDGHEIKDIMVYEVESVTDQATGYMEIEPHHQPVLNSDIKFDIRNDNQSNAIEEPLKLDINTSNVEDNEKYKHIRNMQQLEILKQENSSLRQKMESLETILKKMEKHASEKSQVLKMKDEELKKIMHQYDLLQRASMSLGDQKQILSKVFSESQIKILSGKKKIYWSNDDMAVGYTIRHLSNKRCYVYLSKNLNIPLPALSSIKRWSTLKKSECTKESKKVDNRFEDDSD